MPSFEIDHAIIAVTTMTTIFLSVSAVLAARSAASEREKIEGRIEKAQGQVEGQPEEIKPVWDLASANLELYFRRNLGQNNWIFFLSLLVMTVGIIIIFWGISQSIEKAHAAVPATIATVSGVITEFIGATFLFVYRSTIQQAGEYTRTLERINAVGMAVTILNTIPDNATADDLKSITKAKLVELLVRQANDLPEPTPEKEELATSKPE